MDATYVRKLQGEIARDTKNKYVIKESIKHLEYEKQRLKMKLNRRSWKTQSIQRRLGFASDDIKMSRSFEREMKKDHKCLNEDIVESRQHLKEAASKIKSRKENTTFRYNYLVTNTESIGEEVRKKEMQRDDIQSQIDILHLSQVSVRNVVIFQFTVNFEQLKKSLHTNTKF